TLARGRSGNEVQRSRADDLPAVRGVGACHRYGLGDDELLHRLEVPDELLGQEDAPVGVGLDDVPDGPHVGRQRRPDDDGRRGPWFRHHPRSYGTEPRRTVDPAARALGRARPGPPARPTAAPPRRGSPPGRASIAATRRHAVISSMTGSVTTPARSPAGSGRTLLSPATTHTRRATERSSCGVGPVARALSGMSA